MKPIESHSIVAGVLVVEDDERVARGLASGLSEAGFSVASVGTLAEAARAVRAAVPGVIILDLGLPDGDGLVFLRDLRKAGLTVPVIILTARDAVVDRVDGLDEGADDYLVKPFSFAELLARVRARLRNSRLTDSPQVLRVGDLEVDRLNRVARRGGCVLELTGREFDILAFLAQSAPHPVSRDMLTREVWKLNSRAVIMDNVIDVHLSRLREKVDTAGDRRMIRTIRGVGFVLQDGGAS